MSSQLMGEAVVALNDGSKLQIAFDFDGLIALEEAAGMKMRVIYSELERLQTAGEDPSFKLLRAIFYGGLQQHHPEITLKEVGAIILGNMDALTEAFAAFQGAHGPEGDGGQAGDASGDPSPAGRGTGARSSKAGAARGSTRKASAGKRSGPTRKR